MATERNEAVYFNLWLPWTQSPLASDGRQSIAYFQRVRFAHLNRSFHQYGPDRGIQFFACSDEHTWIWLQQQGNKRHGSVNTGASQNARQEGEKATVTCSVTRSGIDVLQLACP